MDLGTILIQLGIEAFGAFLGFGSALIINYRSNYSKKRKTEIKILDNLINELNDIRTALEEYVTKNAPLCSPIYTPTWDALQNSGMTLELIESQCYNSLINIYSSFYYANEKLRQNGIIEAKDLKKLSENCATSLHTVSCERIRICTQDSKGPKKLKK